jgi:hypothetical protein
LRLDFGDPGGFKRHRIYETDHVGNGHAPSRPAGIAVLKEKLD